MKPPGEAPGPNLPPTATSQASGTLNSRVNGLSKPCPSHGACPEGAFRIPEAEDPDDWRPQSWWHLPCC